MTAVRAVEMSWPLADMLRLITRQIRDEAAAELLRYAHEQQHALAGPLRLSIRGDRLIARAPARPYRPAVRAIPAEPRPACQDHPDPDLWWSFIPAETEEAKRICREQCQVREQCLTDAITRREKAGVFGGRDFAIREKAS